MKTRSVTIFKIKMRFFLCHFDLILLLLVKKGIFFKYDIVLVTQVAFDICSPPVFCMQDFHFENQWFPYVVNNMFGEYGVNCKTEYLIFLWYSLNNLVTVLTR